MFKEFEMTENGLMSYFLGIEVKQQHDGIFISQKKYMKEILEKFKMGSCNSVNTLVETSIKLSKEGYGQVTLQEFGSKSEVFDDHKAIYCLWSWTCESIHGDTNGDSLASCKKDSKVH
jgi:hypothetical protein